MGAVESRDERDNSSESTFANILNNLITLITYFFVFVIVSNSYAHSWPFVTSADGELEGLQSELVAANKDDEAVRRRLRYQDAQLEKLKEEQDSKDEANLNKFGEYSMLHVPPVAMEIQFSALNDGQKMKNGKPKIAKLNFSFLFFFE